MNFLISIREQYQGNKLFTEGDTVYFDPLFERLRIIKSKDFIKNKEGLIALSKSIINLNKIQ